MKKLFAMLLGGISALLAAQSRAADRPASPPPPSPDRQEVRNGFSKQMLIDELKRLCRDPEKVQVVSAMCYDMAVPSSSVEYACRCGAVTAYPRASAAGHLVEQLPYIRRMFQELPYKVTVNADELCRTCGKSGEQRIAVTVACFSCGAEFTWDIRNQRDVRDCRWLAVRPPVRKLDGMELGLAATCDGDPGDGNDAAIRAGAGYIRDHVFCPACAPGIKLTEENPGKDKSAFQNAESRRLRGF